MQRLFHYYSRYQSARGGFSSLPSWGRILVLIAAVPGIILLALSIFAALVSIVVLSLLTVPVYKLVSWVVPSPRGDERYVQATVESARDVEPDAPQPDPSAGESRPRRQIDVRIIE